MIISVDEDDQIQIAKQVYKMAKARQKHRVNHFQRKSLMGQQWNTINRGQQAVKLPNIKVKMQRSQQKNEVRTGRQGRKQSIEGGKLMQLIKKEISIQKKSYFQTISSDKALIIKNTPRSKDIKANKKTKQKKIKINITQGQIQEVLTPPYKIFKSKRQSLDTYLPKTVKKTIKQPNWQEQCTPWHINDKESQSITFD